MARRASDARPERRDQAGAARNARRERRGGDEDDTSAIRAGGPRDRGAQLAAHDRRVRLRHDRGGGVLLRHGAARRARPRIAGARVRTGSGGPNALPPAAGVSFARGCACARPRASRHQAGQHLCLSDGARLRFREGPRFWPGEVRRPNLDSTDAVDGRARDDRNARVHGAGDHSGRRRDRPAGGCLRARLCRVLSPHRPARVRGRQPDEDVPRPRAEQTGPAVAAGRGLHSA